MPSSSGISTNYSGKSMVAVQTDCLATNAINVFGGIDSINWVLHGTPLFVGFDLPNSTQPPVTKVASNCVQQLFVKRIKFR